MMTPSYDTNAEDRLAWLADRAAQTFADDPEAARRWLELPRRDLAGFTPAQCALLGGAPLHRVATLLARVGGSPATRWPAPHADVRPTDVHAPVHTPVHAPVHAAVGDVRIA